MKSRWTLRKASWNAIACGCALAAAMAGCSTSVASRIASDARVREQVMGAIAGNGALAEQMTQRLLATDSLRTRVIDAVLRDSTGAQYVIARIGRNSEALTLFKGMQIAMQTKH